MSGNIEQVRKFYELIWNDYDKTAIPDIIHESFKFRGSLGEEKYGHAGFIEYLDMVHFALDSYKCTIKETVEENSKVFARMKFSGIHNNIFMGFKPTGKRVDWEGAALFNFEKEKIINLWVLSDLKSLEIQLH